MALWTYRCYNDGHQPNLWHRWYAEQTRFQGTHDSVFEFLEQREVWGPPHTKALGEGLIEIRLQGKVKWRIFGFYGSQRREFVIVAIGNHKQNVYSPKEILKTAARIKGEIESGEKGAIVCERPQ